MRHGAVSAIVPRRKIPFDCPGYGVIRFNETRIIHRLHRFFKERLRLLVAHRLYLRDCLLNLCNLWMAPFSYPAPDRVEHDDHGGDHDDRSEACVYETLNRSFRLLRERPEDVCDRFEACDERR